MNVYIRALGEHARNCVTRHHRSASVMKYAACAAVAAAPAAAQRALPVLILTQPLMLLQMVKLVLL
jgi:hypothetical protein